ncbi:hypothetical protein JCM3775_000476 [Rhodotorula graminis]|uniref:U3 small nucleolar RNA-associated protein 11 n=1 Tax=Rhodotorula graminis (strain WP1) TaxID=578459 RepID=A0A194SAM0_RHOGW|nr:uncharacterized protein RHOBADRAFT_51349 [Rhodotorula graminis WP1]KPV77505.1 hypothetical protein RHOBADRAFT_51349 [Rhodotorula graminis WP1]
MVAGKLDLQKRQHRERAQPTHRKKLGLLEKHADYVKRARDFHSKEDRIQKLREKAAMRNKDEFYFGMINSKTKKGIHVQSRGNEPLPTDLVKVLKTQDATYIRMQTKMEQGRVDRLKEQLTSLVDLALPSDSAAAKGKQPAEGEFDEDWDMYSDDEPVASTSQPRNHVVFTDDIDTVRSGNASALLRKRATPTALPLASTSSSSASTKPSSGPTPRTRKPKSRAAASSLEESAADLAATAEQVRAQAAAHRAALETELHAREERLVQLRRATRELELQRALMSRGAKQPKLERNPDDKGKGEDEWWMAGVKGAPKVQDDGEKKLPMAGEGVTTGARVWKWKAQRKR